MDIAPQDIGYLTQAFIAARVPIGIVVLLEQINVEQKNRQRRAVSPGTGKLDLQRGIETAPVGQSRQTVRLGQGLQFFVGVRQLHLGFLGPANLPIKQGSEKAQGKHDDAHEHAVAVGVHFPVGQDALARQAGGNHQGKVFGLGVAVKACDAIDHRGDHGRTLAGFGQITPEQLSIDEGMGLALHCSRPPDQQGTVTHG
jgi:hypothetical protein